MQYYCWKRKLICLYVYKFILGIDVTATNINDSTMFETVLEKINENVKKPKYMIVNAGCKTPHIYLNCQ